MRIGPYEISVSRLRKATGDFITHLPTVYGGWWPAVRESFAGAWQRNIVAPLEDVVAHPTVFACVTLIAGDVSKCRPMLVEEQPGGIEIEVDNPAYSPVIRRPNHYQNRIQFYFYWTCSKLTRGNAYALKERDARGVVTALYLLDPARVRPLVSPSGDVYYALQQDPLSGVYEASVIVPAREIVHDPIYPIYHPLCGLSPIFACGHAASQALTIVNNSSRFFRRGSMIGGVLVAPGPISATNAEKLEKHWNENYAGPENAGKIACLGDGLKYEQPKMMTAVDSQLIDQLKWDDEKICAVFHVPGYKVGVGPLPSYNNVEALGQQYYGDCLQYHFESIELCMTEGLEMRSGLGCEFDISALDRMDSVQRIDVATKGVIGGIFSPNEARARFNLPPVEGGDQVFLQKQNWPIDILGDDAAVPTATPPQPPPPDAPVDPAKVVDYDEVLDRLLKEFAA